MKETATESIRRFTESFTTFEQKLNGSSDPYISSLRRDAIDRFRALGFPTQKDEDWKFTDLAPIQALQYIHDPVYNSRGLTGTQVRALSFGSPELPMVVFVNGMFSEEFSTLPAPASGVNISSLRDAIKRGERAIRDEFSLHANPHNDALVALNTAFTYDGLYLEVAPRTELEQPIQVLYISTAEEGVVRSSFPRNLFVIGEQSRVTIIERYTGIGNGSYFTNAVTELIAGAESVIEHDKLQDESLSAYHLSHTHASLSRSAQYYSNVVALGGQIARNTIVAALNGEGADCTLNGLSLSTGTQHIDNHTTIDHAIPRCTSHEVYKAILDGKSKGVFNGKIFVRPDAQKTDAKQTNKTLLLSDNATMNTKPQLEIFADDVKCTHGATIGQLDEDQIFYLRARGIDLDAARDMLTFAFASDVVNRIHFDPLRLRLDDIISRRLQQGRRNGSPDG